MSKKRKKKKQNIRVKKIQSFSMTCLITALVAGIVISMLLANQFSEHMVWGNVFIQLMVTCFALLLSSAMIGCIFLIQRKAGKIALGFFGGLFLLTTISSMVTGIQLLRDKEFYEQGKYEVIIGKPIRVDYNRPKSSETTYVDSFEVDGIEIITSHLSIDQIYFDSNLKDEMVVVKYLPNSRYAIAVY
ncbi:hypothetical protein [Niallia sp. Krafla_26]|uniref:hypothetical protein n=1 Tax=Niallia sp. Krafla_26 TaxID=3064703 RepID=UPI003D16DA1E